jgi:uncharacterized membrane protein YqaE (UPF0057 family)
MTKDVLLALMVCLYYLRICIKTKLSTLIKIITRENPMNKIVLILLALFLPPIAVLIKEGVGKHLIINIILCILGLLPGIVHAIWLMVRDKS